MVRDLDFGSSHAWDCPASAFRVLSAVRVLSAFRVLPVTALRSRRETADV